MEGLKEEVLRIVGGRGRCGVREKGKEQRICHFYY